MSFRLTSSHTVNGQRFDDRDRSSSAWSMRRPRPPWACRSPVRAIRAQT